MPMVRPYCWSTQTPGVKGRQAFSTGVHGIQYTMAVTAKKTFMEMMANQMRTLILPSDTRKRVIPQDVLLQTPLQTVKVMQSRPVSVFALMSSTVASGLSQMCLPRP